MKNILNPMNPFFRFMNLIVDLIGVNLLFLLCCVPIITIGPALSALYTVSMRLVRHTLDSPVKSFWMTFRRNLKQGILLELLSASIYALLLYNTWLTIQLRIGQQNPLYSVLLAACILCLLLFLCVAAYVFPLLAQFDNTLKGYVQTAFLMCIRHLPKTICVLLLPAITAWLTMRSVGAFAFVSVFLLLIGFVTIAYLQAHLFVSIFDIYIKQQRESSSPEQEAES